MVAEIAHGLEDLAQAFVVANVVADEKGIAHGAVLRPFSSPSGRGRVRAALVSSPSGRGRVRAALVSSPSGRGRVRVVFKHPLRLTGLVPCDPCDERRVQLADKR